MKLKKLQNGVVLMSKPIALYQDKNYSNFLLSYINLICLVKWQGLVMLS